MVTVPAGTFMMGSPAHEAGRFEDEGPQHLVRIAEPLAVGKYEVTRGEFAQFVWDTGRAMRDSCTVLIPKEGNEYEWEMVRGNWLDPGYRQTDRDPVVCVLWRDAQEYVEWLSRKTGKRYRLLSESEWEYAARGGRTTTRYWGESAAEQCRHANARDASTGWTNGVACDDGYARTAPVGSFTKNQYGLHDMSGNVYEWTQDCWNDSYAGAPTDGSAWEQGDCRFRTMRGGAWLSVPRRLRAASRVGASEGAAQAVWSGHYSDFVGFRVARTLTS